MNGTKQRGCVLQQASRERTCCTLKRERSERHRNLQDTSHHLSVLTLAMLHIIHAGQQEPTESGNTEL